MDSQLDHAPCGFVSFRDDGTITAVNTTLADLLGYTRIELEGWHIEKLLPPGGRIFYQTHVFPLLKLHGIAEELYLPLRTKDARDIPMLMNGVRRSRDGVFISDCIFVRMIQRNEYEEQLLQARRLAEQASAAKAHFLSMMSHDLRTPLTAITGYAELIAHGIAEGDEQRFGIDRIREASRELLRMIDDILNFAQLESGRVVVNRSAVIVNEAVARAESLIRLRMQDEELSFSFVGCEDVRVLADADRLQQVLLNLLTNAIKFTPRGGAISVMCESDDAHVRIRVRDNGIGIPPEQLQRIFEPFVQLGRFIDEAGRGVGLGLAISRDLVRLMDGELTVESAPGQGSSFVVELMRYSERASA